MENPTRKRIAIFSFFLLIVGLFFYKTVQKGYVPFPGDLLLAEYQPWRSYAFNGYAPGGIPSKAQYFDPLRQMYPWKTFSIDSMKKGIFPLWNPHNFSGAPLFANFQSAVLFPLNILYWILPEIPAWTILVIIQPLFSAIFVYLLARQYKLSTLASLLSAISYAFCLFMTTFLEYNTVGHYLYLAPLGLLSIEWILRKRKWAFLLLTLTVAVSGLAGHSQLFGGTVAYLLLYLLVRLIVTPLEKKRTIFFLSSLFLFCGVAISGIQLGPGLELIQQSARSSHPAEYFFTNLLIRPEQFILYLIPDIFGNPATRNYLVPFSYPSKALYVGIAALFFAALSFFIRKKDAIWKTIALSTGIISLFVFLSPLSFLLYQFTIPIISSSSPSNFIFFISLGISLLAGFGFDLYRQNYSRKHMVVLLFFGAVLLLSIIVPQVFHTKISMNNVIFSGLLFTCFSFLFIITNIIKNTKKTVSVLFILFACFDLFYFFRKFNPFVPPTYMYPNTAVVEWIKQNAGIARVWGYGSGSIEANFATQTKIYSPDGYDPLFPKHYGELLQTTKNGKLPASFTDTTRSDAVITGGYGKTDLADNIYRTKVLSLLGVSYIIDKTENASTAETFPPDTYSQMATLNDFTIYKNLGAAPRFFLTTSFETYSSPAEFEKKLFAFSFDPKKTILLSESPNQHFEKPLTQQTSELRLYSPNKVQIVTETDAPSLLYLSDTDYPGWKATIDSTLTKIYRANYSFRAVVVPAGIHTVEFRYEPLSFSRGIFISLLGIVISALVYVFISMKPEERKETERTNNSRVRRYNKK